MSGSVGYLTKRFPRLSETFILDEVLGLEAEGVPLRLYALAHPHEPVEQPDASLVRSDVVYLHGSGDPLGAWTSRAAMVRAQAGSLTASPRRYLRVLLGALRERPSVATAKHFFEAVRLAEIVERDDVRHVHAAFAHSPAAVARLLHRLTGIPYSFGAHAKDLYLSEPAVLARRVAESEFVLVCSAAAADDLRRIAGPHAAKVRLAPHGVDTARFRPPATGRPGGPADVEASRPLRLLAVGRLVDKKGYPILLEALARAREGGRAVELEIVGGGPRLRELQTRVEALGLTGAVRFLGACTHQEVAGAYLRADAFVQASVVLENGDRDGTPNALLEAMASGLPVVATAVGGIPEVVTHDENGLLAPPGDAVALADRLVALADDPALRGRLDRMARAWMVEHYDRASQIQAISPLFDRAALARAS